MIDTFQVPLTLPYIIPCILNNIITMFILYKFIQTFLGYRPEHKNFLIVLYSLFFIVKILLSFRNPLINPIHAPYYSYVDKYFNAVLYLLLFVFIIMIAFCYKPTLSTRLSSATLTALSLYFSVPIAFYVFDELYRFIATYTEELVNAPSLRHILYLMFEEYQQIFVYVLEIIIKLLFLFVILRVRRIYEERDMYYMQAVRQQKNNLELKQFRHDMKNHMGALNQMLSLEDEEKARAYLSKLSEMTDSPQLISHTGNVALDSIVNYKLSEAEENEIAYTFNATIPENLNVRDEDIIIIFGNLLDNAIEACLKLEKDRYIHLNLSYQKGLLLIKISNSYNGVIKKSGRKLTTLKSNKSLHGLGLNNVKNALARYNGALDIQAQETEFSVNITMFV